MATRSPIAGRAAALVGRRSERDVLDRLIEAVRGGESRALVVRGEPGVGKTALLDYLVERASDCRVVRAAGVQSEMELAFATLHQLLAPMLEHLEHLPVPQRDALRTAFGVSTGPAPDRFLVALAVLGLLSEIAEDQPLICLVDDEQWLDHASAQVLAFVARRLQAESVGMVFATRVPNDDIAGLPQLVVEGLGEDDARTLLDSVLTSPLDAQVREQIVTDTRGNPLALWELARGLTPAELAGGFGLPGGVPLSGRIEASFRRRLDALPAQTRLLLVLAAADPVGEPPRGHQEAGVRDHPVVGTDREAVDVPAAVECLPGRGLEEPAVRPQFLDHARQLGRGRDVAADQPAGDEGARRRATGRGTRGSLAATAPSTA